MLRLLILACTLACGSIHACGVPREPAYDRAVVDAAQYILHLRVIRLEESGDESDDRAVCDVTEELIGRPPTDADGHVRIHSTSRKVERRNSGMRFYVPGDELTIIASADRVAIDTAGGAVFRFCQYNRGAPRDDTRDHVRARVAIADSKLAMLAARWPRAAAKTSVALAELSHGERTDLLDLPCESDLLVDLTATSFRQPALASAPRLEQDYDTRERLVREALGAAFGLSGIALETARTLVRGEGSGFDALLAPATLRDCDAIAALEDLHARDALVPFLSYLLMHDIGETEKVDAGPVLGWCCRMIREKSAASQTIQWAIIEACEANMLGGEQVVITFARGLGFRNSERVSAAGDELDECGALILHTYVRGPMRLPEGSAYEWLEGSPYFSDGDMFYRMAERIEFLQVYAVVLKLRAGHEAAKEWMRKALLEGIARDDETDLSKIDTVRDLIARKGGSLPHLLK